MTNQLLVYGCGGLGREVLSIAKACELAKLCRWSRIAFIDDSALVGHLLGHRVYRFESLQSWSSSNIEQALVTIAVGDPSIRAALRQKCEVLGLKFATLIHPSSVLGDRVTVGDGSTICAHVSLSCDIGIGENVYIHPSACVGHDAYIGNDAVISSFVDVAGSCSVGAGTFIGMGTMIKQGVNIGCNSIIGMGSMVYSDIPSRMIAMGNPARPMKANDGKKIFG